MTIPGIYSQTDSRWENQELGYNTDPFYNLYHFGCLVTAVANLLWYTGNPNANPEAVNNWLCDNQGFVKGGGNMVWSAADLLLANQEVHPAGFSNNLDEVNAFLQAEENFAIAWITKPGFVQHWSVMPFVGMIADSWDAVLKPISDYTFHGAHLYTKTTTPPAVVTPTPAVAPDPVAPNPNTTPSVVTPIPDPTTVPAPTEAPPAEPDVVVPVAAEPATTPEVVSPPEAPASPVEAPVMPEVVTPHPAPKGSVIPPNSTATIGRMAPLVNLSTGVVVGQVAPGTITITDAIIKDGITYLVGLDPAHGIDTAYFVTRQLDGITTKPKEVAPTPTKTMGPIARFIARLLHLL